MECVVPMLDQRSLQKGEGVKPTLNSPEFWLAVIAKVSPSCVSVTDFTTTTR